MASTEHPNKGEQDLELDEEEKRRTKRRVRFKVYNIPNSKNEQEKFKTGIVRNFEG